MWLDMEVRMRSRTAVHDGSHPISRRIRELAAMRDFDSLRMIAAKITRCCIVWTVSGEAIFGRARKESIELRQ